MKLRVTLALCSIVVVAGLGYALAQMRGTQDAASNGDKTSKGDKSMLRVKVFNKKGELVGPTETEKLVLTDAQWHKRLTDEQFEILRSKDTERPFCGTLLDNKEAGVYTCAGCGLPLFSSDSKFHSGTGWPSFFQPIAKENVSEREDHSHGMTRTEINCARCDGHLGHVFEDGPKPTGLRFCLNSASLNFTPSDKLATLAEPIAEQGAGGRAGRQPERLARIPVNERRPSLRAGAFGARKRPSNRLKAWSVLPAVTRAARRKRPITSASATGTPAMLR